MHAFFATLYYCALRPEEAVAMRVQDVTLPGPDAGDQWCELLIHTATPEVGKQWTDTGEIHEEREPKGRAEGETRTVPGDPALTCILRQHVEDGGWRPLEAAGGRTAPEPPHDRREVSRGFGAPRHTCSEQQKCPPGGRAETCAPGRTRTCGQALRRRLLYPLSYGGRCGGLVRAARVWADP